MVNELEGMGKGVEKAAEFALFLGRLCQGPLEQVLGMIEDKLKYMRKKNLIRLQHKFEEFLKAEGLNGPTPTVSFKYLVPLLQAAALEEDRYLQELWAALLVNFANDDSGVALSRSYIDILERLSPLEAKILQTIYTLPFEEIRNTGVITGQLPEKAWKAEDRQTKAVTWEHEDNTLALSNLNRLGCITVPRSISGGELFHVVNPTLLGKHFVEACSLKGAARDLLQTQGD